MEFPVHIGISKTLGIRGVMATKLIKKGEIIEVCPVIPFESGDWDKIRNSILYYYYFDWEDDKYALPLGYGVLYNHSYSPNAVYEFDEVNGNLVIRAYKDIPQEEEILINYNYVPTDNAPIEWLTEKMLG